MRVRSPAWARRIFSAPTAPVGITVNGTGGANTLDGSIGADIINGFAGADVINGGDGNDSLNGGTENDTLAGGDGNDTFIYTGIGDSTVASESRDIIADFLQGADTISLSQIDSSVTSSSG